MLEKILVRCLDDARVPFRTPDGLLVMGRFYGRDRTTQCDALAEGEIVEVGPGNRSDLHRAIEFDRHLERLPVPAAKAKDKE